jgi:tripartite-type tricarboxylate transporter receptor subunit TctC
MLTRHACRVVVLVPLVALACTRGERRDEWPNRPVRLIVPFGPGGSADVAARLIAPRLAERWQRPVVVDNRPGGDAVVGVQAFVSAKDEHTLLLAPTGVITTNPLLHERLPYDPAIDLVPICAVGSFSIGIAASGKAGIASLADLVAMAKRQPDRYLWSAAAGLPELVFRAFLELEHLSMKHVAYRDVTSAVHDFQAGRIDVMAAAVPTLSPAVESGAGRFLAAMNSARAVAAPDMPTAREAGYPSLTVDSALGFFGWRDMPADLRQRIAADVRDAANDPVIVSRLATMGFRVGTGTTEDFVRIVATQQEQVAQIARIVGLKGPGGARGDLRLR